ncbi:hypothetical protein L1765_11215 [Microaerobacter geothermalis]|uniref:hypothetical protein n=1 Tax=Microaerobacter geothermalis TaxID=674972 RepID=UPI001F1E8BC8|nr:hypothetical protein [Microaerobacter geothermalis]MCF6094532.1 hypothetical protein [Microaerobacter geothermalis]
MTEKEVLFSLNDRLDEPQISATMVYPLEELTEDDKKHLDESIEEYHRGYVLRGKEADDLFA